MFDKKGLIKKLMVTELWILKSRSLRVEPSAHQSLKAGDELCHEQIEGINSAP